MEFEEWIEFYRQILIDFNFSKEEDERSAVVMHSIAREKLMDTLILEKKIGGKDVLIIGPILSEDDAEEIREFEGVKITAGKAINAVREFIPDFVPDIHVTDMEESDDLLVEIGERCILVLHAHGDNIDRVMSVIPKIGYFVGTTQSIPFDKIYNFGGFTDGDRAACMAKHFNANGIKLIGFDFERAEGLKKKKLVWAERILKHEGVL
ncbi:Uncharacterized Rossmann fold enzyme [Archaeoglobus sulfaticallidus PM70-1]|uniref:6-hydroxymethyl-7,8-dihydropterin pyrophosphokinase n=1 Tax=Archaeoglobus sulfaticallidus PM70-1 TaxID=387631 RepID=N0BJZ9_9EURY|nr:6-hydroxymethylpterin diphosphokinase MptE-like protein [Archaeoglobus sulfaticallidus]AGK60826.1 Uncharacterized Rossmann fold enzyme [Archaeoglobus sulfaticallidus PM70-1]